MKARYIIEQLLSSSDPEIYRVLDEWIQHNWDDDGAISAIVLALGDISVRELRNGGDDVEEWDFLAKELIGKLRGIGLFYRIYNVGKSGFRITLVDPDHPRREPVDSEYWASLGL